MKFTWSTGQRPLDGFTVKRGVGSGGFGEVYYALSDGGKEVALKLVRGKEDIELRGIAQCLNLKHANLVNLYDLRTDANGDHWVVMEYVAGEPLSTVLNRHPNGVPADLAREWFLALAKAVGYLHDHGIVHRDLKPANLFIESGTLKVGDCGLSKFISSSQRTANTQSIGTVYYMAPEISTGNYNKQIDIYAAGILLYEMLTGRVPFDGESAGEILIKHLTSPPDLAKVPTDYVAVVSRALAKNPAQRYATIGEMARDVEAIGQRHVPGTNGVHHNNNGAVPKNVEELPSVLPAVTTRTHLAELAGSMALSALLAAILGILYTALVRDNDPNKWYNVGFMYFVTVAVCWVVLIPSKFWTKRVSESWRRRGVLLLLGGLVGAGAMWLNGWMPVNDTLELGIYQVGRQSTDPFTIAAGYLSYFALALAAVRWWRLADRHRPHRFSFFPVVAVGFWSLVLTLFWPESDRAPMGAIAMVTAAAIIQFVSPWAPPPPKTARRLRLRYA